MFKRCTLFSFDFIEVLFLTNYFQFNREMFIETWMIHLRISDKLEMYSIRNSDDNEEVSVIRKFYYN